MIINKKHKHLALIFSYMKYYYCYYFLKINY